MKKCLAQAYRYQTGGTVRSIFQRLWTHTQSRSVMMTRIMPAAAAIAERVKVMGVVAAAQQL